MSVCIKLFRASVSFTAAKMPIDTHAASLGCCCWWWCFAWCVARLSSEWAGRGAFDFSKNSLRGRLNCGFQQERRCHQNPPKNLINEICEIKSSTAERLYQFNSACFLMGASEDMGLQSAF